MRPCARAAALEAVADPNLVFNLRAKLDAAGHYDEFEVDHVANIEMNPSSPSNQMRRSRGQPSPWPACQPTQPRPRVQGSTRSSQARGQRQRGDAWEQIVQALLA